MSHVLARNRDPALHPQVVSHWNTAVRFHPEHIISEPYAPHSPYLAINCRRANARNIVIHGIF